jgi:hypothetical protein
MKPTGAPRGVNQSRSLILTALQTMSMPAVIAEATGLSIKRVHTELANMQEQRLVSGKANHWRLVGPCALETHWRGVRPIKRAEVRA